MSYATIPACDYQFNTIYDSVYEESNHALNRHEDDDLENFSSCGGRLLSIVHIISHGVGIAVKPIIYLIKFLWEICSSPFRFCCAKKGEGWKNLNRSFHSFGNIFLSPFTQTILLIRSIFGILHPCCYFDET